LNLLHFQIFAEIRKLLISCVFLGIMQQPPSKPLIKSDLTNRPKSSEKKAKETLEKANRLLAESGKHFASRTQDEEDEKP